MCVIIYCPKGTKIKKSELKDAFSYNSDGAGLGWIDKKGFINYKKGFMNFNNFWKECKKIINNVEIERVCHFRIGTSGGNIKGLTHPYILDSKSNKKKLKYSGKKSICFMNGVLNNQSIIEGLNDTASFIILESKKKRDIRKEMIKQSPKWAIISTDGVELIGDYECENGIYYSNFNHRYYNNDIFYYSDIFKYTKNNKNIKYSKKGRNIYKIYNYEIEKILKQISEAYYTNIDLQENYKKYFNKYGINKAISMIFEDIISIERYLYEED